MAPNSAFSPAARPKPRASPTVDPTSPTINASSSTDRVTCAFEAPSARNRASSRVRCATMIEKVFRIRKVPTTSATAANTSRKVVMKDSPCSS